MTISLNADSLMTQTTALNERADRPPSTTAARLMTSGAESLMIDPTALDPTTAQEIPTGSLGFQTSVRKFL